MEVEISLELFCLDVYLFFEMFLFVFLCCVLLLFSYFLPKIILDSGYGSKKGILPLQPIPDRKSDQTLCFLVS